LANHEKIDVSRSWMLSFAATRRASAEDFHQQNPITPRYPAGRVRTSNPHRPAEGVGL
jgi:hypothetical protein